MQMVMQTHGMARRVYAYVWRVYMFYLCVISKVIVGQSVGQCSHAIHFAVNFLFRWRGTALTGIHLNNYMLCTRDTLRLRCGWNCRSDTFCHTSERTLVVVAEFCSTLTKHENTCDHSQHTHSHSHAVVERSTDGHNTPPSGFSIALHNLFRTRTHVITYAHTHIRTGEHTYGRQIRTRNSNVRIGFTTAIASI